jgi:16S rRNA (guanine966-N2)-methyltransferase
MRIISGRLKGRQLASFKADHIRPTTDRVKETIFNILMGDIDGQRVLDLYSGTGNLGIEALSRGAAYVECVENHKSSLRIISENLKKMGISQEIRVVPQDVFRYLKSYKGEGFQVIFIDPPFTQKLAHDTMLALQASSVSRPGGLVVIESSRQERIDDKYGAFQLLDRREFGDKSASFFQHKPE